MPTPRRALIIKLRHHGDVLLTTPVAHALKQAYPGIETDMLVYAETADVIRDNPEIRRVFCIDRQWKKQGLRQQIRQERRLLANLRAQNYDWVFNLSDQWRAGIIAKYCGRQSTGYTYAKRNNALWRFLHTHLCREPADAHIVDYHLAALQPLQLPPAPAKVCLHITDSNRSSLKQKLTACGWQGEPYILMHPGSRWLFKCWDDGKTAALLQKLLDSGRNVLLTAAPDPREQEILDNITARLSPSSASRYWILSGCLNLRELAAAIDGADLFIGVDSVPMHMAAALDKPQVALFGPSWVHRWRPYSEQAEVVWAGDFGTLPHPDSIQTDDPGRLLSAIPTEAVWQAVCRKLSI